MLAMIPSFPPQRAQLSISSPELESLLRATFVRLPRHATTGRDPSDSRVSIATGVHRAQVSRIRGADGTTSARQTMQTKERLYSRSAHVLQGCTTDPKFLSSAGLPLDLPMEASPKHRSFEELVDKYAAGKIASTVLKELQRRGNVELLDGDIVRYRSSTARPRGATEAGAAKLVKRLGDTLFRSLLDPEHIHVDVATKPINLTQQQLAALIPEIERSANLYLAGVERQIQARGAAGVNDNPKWVEHSQIDHQGAASLVYHRLLHRIRARVGHSLAGTAVPFQIATLPEHAPHTTRSDVGRLRYRRFVLLVGWAQPDRSDFKNLHALTRDAECKIYGRTDMCRRSTTFHE
jgi:hypothetical protein